jgi:hypothetical protein
LKKAYLPPGTASFSKRSGRNNCSETVFIILNFQKNAYISVWVKFEDEPFPLEADFPDFGPGEGVDFHRVLEDKDPHVAH